MILVIDNYDSFTYNLVHYLNELGAETRVHRNDDLSVEAALGLRADRLSFDMRNALTTSTTQASTRFYGQQAAAQADFSHLSPKLGATWALAPALSAYASLHHGFRAPSEGQLFRAGSATNTARIDAASPLDPNPGNNEASDGGAAINEETSDLRANKSGPANPPTVLEGTPFNFTISTSNLGNQSFAGKKWTEVWAAGQGLGPIKSVASVATVVDELARDYQRALNRFKQMPWLGAGGQHA